MSKLISVEEFQRRRAFLYKNYQNEIEATNIECPCCGKALFVDRSFVVATNPPRYTYRCDCGYIQTM